MDARPHLFGCTPADVVATLASAGFAADIDDARRLLARRLSGGLDTLPPGTSVRRTFRDAVATHFNDRDLSVAERVRDDADGFEKWLFEHPDGATSEAVRIPLQRPGRYTLCLSTQVGCAVGCTFCATGRLGLTRNLEAWEIVAAWRAVARDLAVRDPTARVTGIVFMGQGEPLMNLPNVLTAARVLSDPCGGRITASNITVSTVGLRRPLEAFVAKAHPYRLILSLHSAVPERRARLVPIAARQPVTALLPALREHQRQSGDRITLAWTLIGGENHGPDEVTALCDTFGDLPIRVNLIDLNRWDEGDGRRRATDAERIAFVQALHSAGIATQRRYSGGAGRHAACGMLASRRFTDLPGTAAPDPWPAA